MRFTKGKVVTPVTIRLLHPGYRSCSLEQEQRRGWRRLEVVNSGLGGRSGEGPRTDEERVPSLRLMKRLQRIERLAPGQQKALF